MLEVKLRVKPTCHVQIDANDKGSDQFSWFQFAANVLLHNSLKRRQTSLDRSTRSFQVGYSSCRASRRRSDPHRIAGAPVGVAVRPNTRRLWLPRASDARATNATPPPNHTLRRLCGCRLLLWLMAQRTCRLLRSTVSHSTRYCLTISFGLQGWKCSLVLVSYWVLSTDWDLT